MSCLRILVCDDYKSGFDAVKRAIGSRHAVQPLVGPELRSAFVSLFERVSLSLLPDDDSSSGTTVSNGAFRDTDVAIVDNNLSALQISGAWLTAESVVGYIRAFTDVAYVVSLNRNPDVDFDLRYLVGDYQSHADIALNTPHLCSDVLWTGHAATVGSGQFAPWYWPNLEAAAQRRRSQIVSLEQCDVDAPLLDVVMFPIEYVDILSRRARGVLSSDAVDSATLREVSLLDFFNNACRSVPAAVREEASDRARDADPAAKAWIARLAAADLEKWMRRDVLGPQDVLVDLPHLLTRMPFLLGDKAREGREWNEVLSETERPFGLDEETYENHLAGSAFEESPKWLPGPCFWWPKLRGNEELSDRFFASRDKWADVVFCEDVSEFRPIPEMDGSDETLPNGPEEFEAEFEGAWRRRYVASVTGKQYSPRSRFAR